ncbi:hypothetical protein Purlil1_13348 [Purpureocillium lilacinum]|uniref:Uncharacterized protein n=1 Tax=Purpureocillium lilacinum TaxID=33203 RepID=A0ABR0BEH8_PURLI|nr:hypothetical protein Purlil1_13348 [Purpureocillium lilacinum]
MAVPEDAEPKNRSEYTVEWVCALPKEQTAATGMLDRHPDLPNLPKDDNAYTLRSIGPHNIAIACLPRVKYGLRSDRRDPHVLKQQQAYSNRGVQQSANGHAAGRAEAAGDICDGWDPNTQVVVYYATVLTVACQECKNQGRTAWDDFYGPKLVRLRAFQRRI